VRPDGYGEWIEHGRRVGFFLELDHGTEPLPRLLDKLTGYSHLTELGIHHPLLILVPTTVREGHLHQRLRTDHRLDQGDGSGLIVATAAADQLATTATSPADTVWLRPNLRTVLA
jgi:Replication-relaxation